jgi:hypothetical protein
MYKFAIIVILLLLILFYVVGIWNNIGLEHQMPGHGSVGQHGLVENFYTSGALLRAKSEPTGSMQTIDQADFSKRLKNYYQHKSLNS